MSVSQFTSLCRQSPITACFLALRQRAASEEGAFSVPVALMLMIVGVIAAAAFQQALVAMVADAINLVRGNMGI